MTTDLEYLIQLQSKDSTLDSLDAKAEALSQLIATKNNEIKVIKEKLAQNKESLKINQLKKKEFEIEAQSKETQIKKGQGELNSLKTNEAYKTKLGEIETAKIDLEKIEDVLLDLMEKVEEDNKKLKDAEIVSKELESEKRTEIQKFEEEKKKFLDESKQKKTERDQYASSVPVPLKEQYDTRRARGNGVAIVPLSGYACGGCELVLTPNKFNEAKKGKSLVICEDCMRIVYIPLEQKERQESSSDQQTVSTS